MRATVCADEAGPTGRGRDTAGSPSARPPGAEDEQRGMHLAPPGRYHGADSRAATMSASAQCNRAAAEEAETFAGRAASDIDRGQRFPSPWSTTHTPTRRPRRPIATLRDPRAVSRPDASRWFSARAATAMRVSAHGWAQVAAEQADLRRRDRRQPAREAAATSRAALAAVPDATRRRSSSRRPRASDRHAVLGPRRRRSIGCRQGPRGRPEATGADRRSTTATSSRRDRALRSPA